MSIETEQSKTKQERIARLRKRLKDAKTWPDLRGVLAAVFDLLEDEL